MVGTWGGVILTTKTFLKIVFCEFWTSIKLKIGITCAYKESEIKTKMIHTGAMATAKSAFGS